MIKEVIRLLEDGMWHSFSEIKEKSNLTENHFGKVVQFLKEFDLADIDDEQKKAKISPFFLELQV
jgi:hypothetical protein